MFKELIELVSSETGKAALKGIKAVRDALSGLALYITLAFIAAVFVYAVAVRNRDGEQLIRSRKLITGLIAGYAAGVIAVLGSLRIICYALSGDINANFWLMIGLIALVAVGIVVSLALKVKKVKGAKWVALGFAVAFAVYAIVLVCVVPPVDESNKPLSWSMYLFSAILVSAIVVLALVFGKNDKGEYDSKSLSYAAVCIALSFALSYIKFFQMPQGGSVTFASLLPLALYSYMFGTKKGVIAGVVYGLLQFIQSPQFYEPMQALLDYPVAFAGIGLAGLARSFKFLKGNAVAEFAVGATIAVLFRYASHVMSGYYVYYSWAWEGWSPIAYSFVYNTYVLVDIVIVIAVGCLALASRTFRRTVLSVNSPAAGEPTAADTEKTSENA